MNRAILLLIACARNKAEGDLAKGRGWSGKHCHIDHSSQRHWTKYHTRTERYFEAFLVPSSLRFTDYHTHKFRTNHLRHLHVLRSGRRRRGRRGLSARHETVQLLVEVLATCGGSSASTSSSCICCSTSSSASTPVPSLLSTSVSTALLTPASRGSLRDPLDSREERCTSLRTRGGTRLPARSTGRSWGEEVDRDCLAWDCQLQSMASGRREAGARSPFVMAPSNLLMAILAC